MLGLLEGVGVLLFLELAGFSAFSTDLDEGGVLSMSLIYIELIPDQQGFSECIIWATSFLETQPLVGKGVAFSCSAPTAIRCTYGARFTV